MINPFPSFASVLSLYTNTQTASPITILYSISTMSTKPQAVPRGGEYMN
jgi:hypothetical protein